MVYAAQEYQSSLLQIYEAVGLRFLRRLLQTGQQQSSPSDAKDAASSGDRGMYEGLAMTVVSALVANKVIFSCLPLAAACTDLPRMRFRQDVATALSVLLPQFLFIIQHRCVRCTAQEPAAS